MGLEVGVGVGFRRYLLGGCRSGRDVVPYESNGCLDVGDHSRVLIFLLNDLSVLTARTDYISSDFTTTKVLTAWIDISTLYVKTSTAWVWSYKFGRYNTLWPYRMLLHNVYSHSSEQRTGLTFGLNIRLEQYLVGDHKYRKSCGHEGLIKGSR